MKIYALNQKENVEINESCVFTDPCYVFSDEMWDELCSLMFDANGKLHIDDRNNILVVESNGEKAYLFGTAYGDGSYDLIYDNHIPSEMAVRLGVDAGMLSMIPESFMKANNLVNRYGSIDSSRQLNINALVDENTKMTVKNGDFSYGKYVIKTS